MSKTFKSATNPDTTLRVREVGGAGVELLHRNGSATLGSMIAPSDAPALALAILEAAGHVDASKGGNITQVSNAMYLLQEYAEVEARKAAAEADRVALEAEALKLFNASRISRGLDELDWGRVTEREQREWLAVARKAREIAEAKAAGQ